MSAGGAAGGYEARRYAASLVLTLTLLVFMLAAPDEPWSRSVAAGLVGALLCLVLATSAIDRPLRVRGVAIAALVTAAAATAAAAESAPSLTGRAASGALAAAAPVLLAMGVVRTVANRGVTPAALVGGVTIYVLLGLTFAFVFGSIARIDSAPLFGAEGGGSTADHVYFSFTALTTTGFGDLAAASDAGRAAAVLESVLGQVYLVTVVALLVGNLQRRRAGTA